MTGLSTEARRGRDSRRWLVLGLGLGVALVVLVLAGWAVGTLLPGTDRATAAWPADRSTLHFFVDHRRGWLTSLMKVLTFLGSASVLLPLVALVGFTWWRRRREWRPAFLLVGAFGGAAVISSAVKSLAARARPPAGMAAIHVTGYAFPSGHAIQAAATFGMLALLLASAASAPPRRAAASAAAALVILLVGVTRLYLGVHWLTDVVGGLVLGALWTLVLRAQVLGALVLGAGVRRSTSVVEG